MSGDASTPTVRGPTTSGIMSRITSLSSNPGAAIGRLISQEMAKRSTNLVIPLRTPVFICAWLGIVTLHCVCAWYLTQLARVYWFLKHPRMEFWSKLATGDRIIYLRHASVIWGLIAALHYWQLLCILVATLRARELTFPDHNSSDAWRVVSRLKLTQSGKRRLSSLTSSGHLKKVGLVSRVAKQAWGCLFGRHGIFGVESRLFHIIFTVREVVEVVSQTFQAKRSSEQLPRPWLNNILVALIVTNCWSTPILQHVFRRHQGKERVVCMLLDAILNMGTSMAVPLAVFWPYYTVFNATAFSFPVPFMYDDIWYSKLVMETRLLFSMSTADMFSKIVPHLGIYTSVVSATTLVLRRRARVDPAVTATDPAASTPYDAKTANNKQPQDEQVDKQKAPLRTQLSALSEQSKSPAAQRKKMAVHALFFIWGFAVLALHLNALTRLITKVEGCRQSINSWFASGYPCSVYNYNCYRQGVASPNEDSWAHLDTRSLSYLGISHCPELRMPAHFQRFSSLGTLTIHNATVVEWSKETAVSATKHTDLSMVLGTRLNMTRLPDGLLEPLPQKLVFIELSHTTLTSLPDDLHTRWHAIASLFIENSPIVEFPKTLLSLPFTKLSLHGNPMERVPELGEKRWKALQIAMNTSPIKELPDKVIDGTAIQFLCLEGSQITTLPAWVKTNVKQAVWLYGTPFCAKQVNDTREGALLVACKTRDERATGKIPMPIMDALFPI